jgi:hypothetical protein
MGIMKTHPEAKALLEFLKQHNACSDATDWVTAHQDRSFAKLWASCDRGDWLLWLAAKAGAERKAIVLAACDCAELALRFIPKGEDRPRLAIEAARAWTRGEATIAVVRSAESSAWAAALHPSSTPASASQALEPRARLTGFSFYN